MTHFLPVLDLMTSTLRRRLSTGEAPVSDPGDHPALRRMSPRELADLPFPRPQAVQPGVDALGRVDEPIPEPHDARSAA